MWPSYTPYAHARQMIRTILALRPTKLAIVNGRLTATWNHDMKPRKHQVKHIVPYRAPDAIAQQREAQDGVATLIGQSDSLFATLERHRREEALATLKLRLAAEREAEELRATCAAARAERIAQAEEGLQ